MSRIKQRLFPLVITVAAIAIAWIIMHKKPEVVRKPPPRTAQMSVETAPLRPQDYRVVINSYGTIEPRTRGELKSQVNGQIVFVSKNFRAGGYFE